MRRSRLHEGARPEELAAARAALEIAEQRLAAGRRGATRSQRNQIDAALTGVAARLEAARSTAVADGAIYFRSNQHLWKGGRA